MGCNVSQYALDNSDLVAPDGRQPTGKIAYRKNLLNQIAAITGASQHLVRGKVEFLDKMFTKTMIRFSREAGIADQIASSVTMVIGSTSNRNPRNPTIRTR